MPTLVAVAPHPDDEAYAFGGTIAQLGRAGWDCRILFVTDGELGERHDGGPRESVGGARVRESEASCSALGATAVHLQLPDGGLSAAPSGEVVAALRREFDAAGREGLVLSLGPDGAYGHPDHVAVFRWVTEAALPVAALQPAVLFAAFPRGLFLPQYELCKHMMGEPPVPAAHAIGTDESDFAIDISAAREVKLAAIAAHRSQLPGEEAHALFPPGIVDRLLDVERYIALDQRSFQKARAALRPFLVE